MFNLNRCLALELACKEQRFATGLMLETHSRTLCWEWWRLNMTLQFEYSCVFISVKSSQAFAGLSSSAQPLKYRSYLSHESLQTCKTSPGCKRLMENPEPNFVQDGMISLTFDSIGDLRRFRDRNPSRRMDV